MDLYPRPNDPYISSQFSTFRHSGIPLQVQVGQKHLNGDYIIKDDPGAICPDGGIQIREAQGHSINEYL